MPGPLLRGIGVVFQNMRARTSEWWPTPAVDFDGQLPAAPQVPVVGAPGNADGSRTSDRQKWWPESTAAPTLVLVSRKVVLLVALHNLRDPNIGCFPSLVVLVPLLVQARAGAVSAFEASSPQRRSWGGGGRRSEQRSPRASESRPRQIVSVLGSACRPAPPPAQRGAHRPSLARLRPKSIGLAPVSTKLGAYQTSAMPTTSPELSRASFIRSADHGCFD